MELRHLRYFTAVVECKGYREASRRLHIAQPSISQAVSDLEGELGLKLFSRTGRSARLRPEGEIFYADAVRILQQAEAAIVTAKRAAQGKVGRLSIGFIGSATLSFLPDLIRRYKLEYPNVKLALHDLYPVELDQACDRGEIDIAITRPLSLERSKNRQSRVLLRDPLVAVLPRSRKLKSKKIRLADLANERFILFHRKGAPAVFDTIVGACRSHGFSPQVENEPNSMQTILSLVEAEEGVAGLTCLHQQPPVEWCAVCPACARSVSRPDRGVATGRALHRIAHISRLSKCQCGRDSRKGRPCSVLDGPDQVIAVLTARDVARWTATPPALLWGRAKEALSRSTS